ncbi:site-specific integrase [Vibrio cyclitrophicus]|uniref:site-specific integrase n=1 Tax=Vibrio cyclitrophicus TaxID=47951 RepID=UPI00148D0AE5
MARRRFDSSKLFHSKARLVYLKQFHEGKPIYSNLNGCVEDGWDWDRKPDFIPKMPIILTGHGVPWELGNIYLLDLLDTSSFTQMESIQDRAKSLCFYLKFIEDENLDLLEFPVQARRRPTYLFRYKLQELIDLGMAPSTASKHIGHVISFYRGLLTQNLIDESRIGRRPFRTFKKSVQTLGSLGLSRFKEVRTTDISVRVVRSEPRLDRIIDGGELRPLSVEEQKAIMWGVEQKYCSIETELIMLIMLNTGARIQSACTLRVGHVKDAYRELIQTGKNWVFIHSHRSRFPIDTKFGKHNDFRFPKFLIEKLYIYINSEVHIKRMNSSFFGLSDENYVCLTEQSNSFYTSRSEIRKRQNGKYHQEENTRDLSIQNGNTLRANVRNFIKRVKKEKPILQDFSPHDLRATYGMNIVRLLANDLDKRFTTVHMELAVKAALNHNDIATSRLYVNFDEKLVNFNSINEMYERFVLDGYQTLEAIYGEDNLDGI